MAYSLYIDCTIDRSKYLTQGVLVLAGSALLTISAWISLPIGPVPLTLQTLAVLLVGSLLGPYLGMLAVITYLAEGCMGFPVFAGGQGGIIAFCSPTLGYKLGFIAAAAIAGYAAERGHDRKFWSALPWLAVAHQSIFVFGVIGLIPWVGIKAAVSFGLIPFLGCDVIKFSIAALVMSQLWNVRNKNSG